MSETERRAMNEGQRCDVRMSDTMGTAGDDDGSGDYDVALTMEAASCVGKRWERVSG